MDICLLWLLCVVGYRSLRRDDHSSRGVPPTVMRRCVWPRNLVEEEALVHGGLSRQRRWDEPDTCLSHHFCDCTSLSVPGFRMNTNTKTLVMLAEALPCLDKMKLRLFRDHNERLFWVYTGYTQKNCAVSKVNKKFISHLSRAQRTPSAAATVQISHALPAIRFSYLLRGRGASFQDGVTAGKGFLCSVFRYPDLWLQCSVSFVHCNQRSGQLKTEHRKPCPAVTPSWKLAPRPRSKHEKRTAGSAWETWTVVAADGVRCAHVRWEINFLLTVEPATFFCVYSV